MGIDRIGINKVVSIAHVSWFFVGFDLVLLPLLAREIGAAFFPNIDPKVSILAVYGTFSLSLLARFFGGIILGAAADSYGRKPIVTISLLVMSILTLISAFLPSVHDVKVEYALSMVISFIILRIVIGFFVGGIWPTVAIFAMEKIYDHDKNKESFEESTKKRTRASAIMQSGYHTGHMIAVFISLGLLAAFNTMPIPIWHYYYFSFKDAFTWRTLSFIGGVFGIVWSVYFSNSEPSLSPSFLNRKMWERLSLPLRALLVDKENNGYRDILFSFWLIITGLLYMYYSVITILPEMLVRNGILLFIPLSNINYPLVTILILISTLAAHLWLGFFCHNAWEWSKGWKNSQEMPGGFERRIICLLLKLRHIWKKIQRLTANYFGIQYADGIRACEYAEDGTLDGIRPYVIYKNVDLIIMIFIGFILIIFGILGGASFYFLFNLKPGFLSKLILIYILVIFIMVALSGWALIPSMLSSRFPVYFRATASNIAYNGGLAIGFASPFIMLENFLTYKSEWLIFVPVILGASAMIIGAARFINMKNKASSDND